MLEPSLFALQRKLPARDGAKWRTVHQGLNQADTVIAMGAAQTLGKVGGEILWRVVLDDEKQAVLASWTPSAGWH